MLNKAELGLEETLLTMDIVDSLRHEQAWLDGHAGIEEKMSAMKDKLSRIYQQQGITVTDEILEAGVKAKLDNRFVHAPKESIGATFVSIYVNRLKWFLAFLSGVGVALISYFAYWLIAVLPLIYSLQDINNEIASLSTERNSIVSAAIEAQRTIKLIPEPTGRIVPTVLRLISESNSELDESLRISRAIPDPLAQPLTLDSYKKTGSLIESRVKESFATLEPLMGRIASSKDKISDATNIYILNNELTDLNDQLKNGNYSANFKGRLQSTSSAALTSLIAADIKSARQRITSLASDLASYEQLISMSTEAKDLRDLGVNESLDDKSKSVILTQYNLVSSALAESNLSVAQQTMADLRSSVENLLQAYSIRIVSGSNVKSGVWRYPNNNQSSKNYYLIVEAINLAGRPIRLPIQNEETGKYERVTSWGVRVDKSQYEKVKADKIDNGLIDNPKAGEKIRGESNQRWAFSVPGGYITSW
jgi:hypothetical protein